MVAHGSVPLRDGAPYVLYCRRCRDPAGGLAVSANSAAVSAVAEPLSPELVLVCPELRRGARAALPERPWELAVKLSAPSPRVDRAGPTASVMAPPSPRPAAGRLRPRDLGGPLGLLFVSAALVVAAPSRDAPTLDVSPAPRNRAASVPSPTLNRTPRAEFPGVETPRAKAPAAIARRRAKPLEPNTSESRPVARRHAQPSVARPGTKPLGSKPPVPMAASNLAVPDGGYVVERGGRLRVDIRARSIARLDASLGCVGQLVLVDIPIAADGHFVAVRRAGSRRAVTVRVGGAFVRRGVHVSLRASGAGCDGRKIELVGRLS